LTTAERDQPRTAFIATSALLVVLGGLVKHNMVALPLAICTWAAIYDRRSFAKFVVSVLAAGCLAIATLYGIWGQRIVADVLYHSRVIWWPRILQVARGTILFLLPIFFITAVGFWLSTDRRKINFVMIYVLWSTVVGFPLLAGEGISLNVLFDLLIALAMGSVGCVLVLQQRNTHFWIGARRIVMIAIILPVIVWALYKQTTYDFYREWHDASAWSELVDAISKVDGRVACDKLAVCYWAGKPFEIDFFNYGQKLYKNVVNDKTILQRRFESGYYAAILLTFVPSSTDPSVWIPVLYLPETETSTLLTWYAPIRCLQIGLRPIFGIRLSDWLHRKDAGALSGSRSECLLMRRRHPVKPDTRFWRRGML